MLTGVFCQPTVSHHFAIVSVVFSCTIYLQEEQVIADGRSLIRSINTTVG